MRIDDFEKYNFNDMLSIVEKEMEIHIEAIQAARKGIGQLWEDVENMSEYICYLESILKQHKIDFCRQEF